MKTFCIQTLGCKVNQYESEQVAGLLRARGLEQTESPADADLRVVNTCSVTVQAASKSRQTVRRSTRSLSVLQHPYTEQSIPAPAEAIFSTDAVASVDNEPSLQGQRRRVIVMGCWATSNKAEASLLPGVTAVLGHHDDVAGQLDRLLGQWQAEDQRTASSSTCCYGPTDPFTAESPREPGWNDGWMIKAGTPARDLIDLNKPHSANQVNENPDKPEAIGTTSLPLLDRRQTAHQRAFLKIQDGCDAHCTYCIIPQLRPTLWSKPLADTVEEARRLVAAGHVEIVLTGIFLGAYGQPTALRRRQPAGGTAKPFAELIEALCTRVPGLRRVRLSSLEPGDLSDELINVLRRFPQVVPHFHVPLQSGSDELLRRMNRQYRRDDFLRMVDQLYGAFDRPALTTDIIVGFPGETDERFRETLEVVDRARFIHTHAFSYSPRPHTAAARWTRDFVRGPVVNERIDRLHTLAAEHSYAFRRQFLGQTVELLVERPGADPSPADPALQHGRCERYFDVYFETDRPRTGESVRVRIDRVSPSRTFGTILENA